VNTLDAALGDWQQWAADRISPLVIMLDAALVIVMLRRPAECGSRGFAI
jgi:hypothetical protein